MGMLLSVETTGCTDCMQTYVSKIFSVVLNINKDVADDDDDDDNDDDDDDIVLLHSPHGSQMSSVNMSRQSTAGYNSDVTTVDFETPTAETADSLPFSSKMATPDTNTIRSDVVMPTPARIRWAVAFQKVCTQLNQVCSSHLCTHCLCDFSHQQNFIPDCLVETLRTLQLEYPQSRVFFHD